MRNKNNLNIQLGDTTDDEMCTNYIYYYPASDVTVCKSTVDPGELNNWFTSRGISDNSLSNLEKYQKLNFDNSTRLSLIELYSTSKLSLQCQKKDGINLEGNPTNWTGIQRPRFQGENISHMERSKEECPAANDYFKI
ncbi:hypothetical protein FO519_008546 [Halicephalobus sp. NKZ332]|nr:hypothetical protein FO519_008546 [Halicephalobus sp. NKZ332]